jgi:hypothetical protein
VVGETDGDVVGSDVVGDTDGDIVGSVVRHTLKPSHVRTAISLSMLAVGPQT